MLQFILGWPSYPYQPIFLSNLCCAHTLGCRTYCGNWLTHWVMILKNPDFPSLSNCQLPILSQLGFELHSHYHPPCWNFLPWTSRGLRNDVITVVNSNTLLLCCFQQTIFLYNRLPILGLTLFYSLLTILLESWGKESQIDVSCRAESSTVSYSLHVIVMCFSILTVLYHSKKLSWWRLRDALFCVYSNKSLRMKSISILSKKEKIK